MEKTLSQKQLSHWTFEMEFYSAHLILVGKSRTHRELTIVLGLE